MISEILKKAGRFSCENFPGIERYIEGNIKNFDELQGPASCSLQGDIRESWFASDSGEKIVSWQGMENIDPSKAIVVGGICSLMPADRERIRSKEIIFSDLNDFEKWFRSFYPRLDQIHDCVGIPPKAVSEIVYVVEDSIWARRISEDSGGVLSVEGIERILREVHKERGEEIISRWLKLGGYRGPVRAVYSSEYEDKMDSYLRTLKRLTQEKIKPSEVDRMKVYMMYTGLWPDILGIDGHVVIYEPFHHFNEVRSFRLLKRWINDNPYGESGDNSNVSALGFIPYGCSEGPTRQLGFESVPHFGNIDGYSVEERNLISSALNLFPKYYKEASIKGYDMSDLGVRIFKKIKEVYCGE